MSASIDYSFLKNAGRIINSGQSKTLIVTGNIYDLFFSEPDDAYVPLLDFLASNWKNVRNRMLVTYEVNGPIRFLSDSHRTKVKDAWFKMRYGLDENQLAIKTMVDRKLADEIKSAKLEFEDNLQKAIGNPTVALEVLRQICLCSRTTHKGKPLLEDDLIIMVEGAELLIPEGEIARLSDVDRHRISICYDWFQDPGFVNGDDCVVLISESRSSLNSRIDKLPYVMEVSIPSPDPDNRKHFIRWFNQREKEGAISFETNENDFVTLTGGLSIQALQQIMRGARHEKRKLNMKDVISQVETFVKTQLGEDVVEFKKPSHTLNDVVGFSNLKSFLASEVIPRLHATGDGSLSGIIVCGPNGAGKTFLFEAVASELNTIVLVLKNLRSQWFGQTDVIIERLRRILSAISKALIFVDEADTQFGQLGSEAHSTERRLTGKIQQIMSDPQLKGQITWLLMTARIHLLSPDIRRPGRGGDLIIPVLDPCDDDRKEFVKWVIEPVLGQTCTSELIDEINEITSGFFVASFAALRSELASKRRLHGKPFTIDELREILADHLSPAIIKERKYQTLQALVHCSRRSLLPNPDVTDEDRQQWEEGIRRLETEGIR